MALTRTRAAMAVSGGPVFLQSIGGGSFAVLDDVANGDTRLYTDTAGTLTQLGSTTYGAGGFVRLTNGSYLLYRQPYDLTYGGATYEVLDASGNMVTGETDVAGGTGRAIAGPTATATAGGGFFIGYTDGVSGSATTVLTFSPPGPFGSTTYGALVSSDAGYRFYTPASGTAAYAGSDFGIANTGTVVTTANGGSVTGLNVAGPQSVGGTATLGNGTVVESYLNGFYFPVVTSGQTGLNLDYEIAVRLVTPSGPGNEIAVSQNALPTSGSDSVDMPTSGNGGIQVVALPNGFAVIWHDVHYDNSGGGYTANGFDTKIRYFDNTGTALTGTIKLYYQTSDLSSGQVGASATSLGDGRIAITYLGAGIGGANGTNGSQLNVGVIGVLGSTFGTTAITGLARGDSQSNEDIIATGNNTVAVSYTDNVSGSSINTFSLTQPTDFSGDGRSDLLLQNTNGQIVVNTQANLVLTGGAYLGNPGPSWHVVASADFNGDGQQDILLQNDSGALVDYLMNGTAIASGNSFGNPGSAWHVRGTGDFNGDGKADFVLGNDDGSIVIYNTNGAGVTAAAYVGNPGPGWTVEGVADFNGDGNADILVQNTNGQLVDYLMSGDAIASAAYLGNPGPGWAVAGTGDYNGDGKADILVHNDNGADIVFTTNGAAITSGVYVGNPGANYTGTVAGVDLNGDGSTDLVLQGTDSTLVGFTLNGAAQITAGAVLGTPGAGWKAVGNDPVQFINGTASAAGATIAATAGIDQFNFTSALAGAHAISGFDAAQDVIALSSATFANYAAVQANEAAYQGGTFLNLTPGTGGAALIIQGVTPGQLSASNFVMR